MAERTLIAEEREMTESMDLNAPGRRPLLGLVTLLTLLAALIALGIAAAPAPAAEELSGAEIVPSETQAGGHPDVNFVYKYKYSAEQPTNEECHCDDPRLIITDLPEGLIGNPHSAPTCTLDAYAVGKCPVESQVGVMSVSGVTGAPIYNMVTHPDQAGLLGFTIPFVDVPVFIDLASRTEGDYGLVSSAGPIYHLLVFAPPLEIELWGVPADAKHDGDRFPTPLSACFPGSCVTGIASQAPRSPFMQNPTTCGVPLSGGVDLEYYSGNTFHQDVPFPSMTGCDSLSFNPSLTAQPTTTEADTPSGLDVNLKVPQLASPDTPSPSEIRSATLTLPEGFTFNPGAADGKTACSDVDSAIGLTRGPATCPEFSKVGTARIDSSALPGPVNGAIYLGQPRPGDTYRLILTGDGFGTHIKLPGSIKPDPQTGRLVISFIDLPQTPLSEFDMHIFGSERGSLATPRRCGTYELETLFVPWNSSLPNQTSKSSFDITSGPGGSPCPGPARPFAPSLDSGSSNPTAGAHSPFNLRIERRDGDQNLTGLTVRAAPGFAATLKGVPYCPESALSTLAAAGYSGQAETASPACPEASQVGTAIAGAGPGTHPVYVQGKVYLAGPYKGAPLSLMVVVPAVSGPYDLGVVAIRAAVFVDPTTARVSTISDPLPTILDGIPLRTRLIEVSLSRPNFTFNPTNCDPFSIDTELLGDEGGVATPSNHFQAANCADLSYGPKISIRLRGGLQRRGHPAIHAVLQTSEGEANTRSTSVTLPKGELLDNSHLGDVCTRVQFAQDSCPEASVVGRTEVTSPALDAPLSGLAYLRSSEKGLPDLALKLKGQVDVEIVGKVDSVRERMRVRFLSLPDLPVSRFVLDMKGGSRGLLQNSESVCGGKLRATVLMKGQNGLVTRRKPRLRTNCKSAPRRIRAAARHKRGGRTVG
jgi:hypothetical protein